MLPWIRNGATYAHGVDRLMELALVVKAVNRELERWANDAMRPLGVTAAQADALVVISHAEPISLKELGDLLIAESGHPKLLFAGFPRRPRRGCPAWGV